MRALEELVEWGWAEIVHKEAGKPVTYRFIDHGEWALVHPGYCVEKSTMPWEGEGDPLAKQLHAVSGGLVKFYPGQMTGLRKSGMDDDQITAEFRIFLDRNPQKGQDWKTAYYRFHRHLLHLAADLRKVANAKNSCSGVSRGSDTYQSHRSDTSSRAHATCTSRTGATQVVELNSEIEREVSRQIPTPRSRGRASNLPTKEIHGRGFPPSKPSPKEEGIPA
ncbi:MAG TPA: hypothetical protein VJN89_00700 [Candidatus Acidoferrum sp.]|nr:hypothetical protein [Candidatus Acidoferrum sp.]